MDEGGYDPDRFIDRVLHGFKCCICHCVLNDPRLCEAEEHQFCFNCISQYLPISQTCPECRQHLTLETLKYPGRNLLNILSELRIKCEYINRGCPEHVELGNLQNHVNNCEYRPITCEDCNLEVNAKDEENHKKSPCQLGGANIQNIRVMKMNQQDMTDNCLTNQASLSELREKQNKLEKTQNRYGERLSGVENDLYRMEADQILQNQKLDQVEEDLYRTEGNLMHNLNEVTNDIDEIRTKQDKMEDNQELSEVTNSLEEIHPLTSTIQDEMRSEVTGIKRRHDDNLHGQVKIMKANPVTEPKICESKTNGDELKAPQIQILEMARKQDQMEVKQDETKKGSDDMKQTQEGINDKVEEMAKDFDEIKQTQEEINEKVEEMAIKNKAQKYPWYKMSIVATNTASTCDLRCGNDGSYFILIGP